MRFDRKDPPRVFIVGNSGPIEMRDCGVVALEPDEAQGGLLLARSYRALGRPRDACAVLGAIRQPGSELRAPLADALAPCPPP